MEGQGDTYVIRPLLSNVLRIIDALWLQGNKPGLGVFRVISLLLLPPRLLASFYCGIAKQFML